MRRSFYYCLHTNEEEENNQFLLHLDSCAKSESLIGSWHVSSSPKFRYLNSELSKQAQAHWPDPGIAFGGNAASKFF